MTEPAVESMDLRDRRGRLTRFVIAVAVGLVLTTLGMRGILAVSVEPNTDPVGASTPALLAIAMFVVTASFTLKVLTTLARRSKLPS
ncbi:MAG: hypothetical protein H0T79_13810 [Deltaproteobacteria bacterium]|nr:hypothetical protein [Deltaproteobacteria bacterium]